MTEGTSDSRSSRTLNEVAEAWVVEFQSALHRLLPGSGPYPHTEVLAPNSGLGAALEEILIPLVPSPISVPIYQSHL